MQFSKSKRLTVANKFDWHCAYCGVELSEETLVIDHVTPKSSGGTNNIQNLLPACRSCNSIKGTKTVEQFRLYISFKKVVNQPVFNQSQIEFLEKSGAFKALNITNNHRFFFEEMELSNE